MEDMVATPIDPLERDLDEVLGRMGPLWDDLRQARVFLTGGTGFFGCWLLETLLWGNDRLGLNASAVVLTRQASAFRARTPHLAGHPAIQIHEGDVRTFGFPGGSFTHVVHAAVDASPTVTREDAVRIFDTIVEGTRRALAFARHAGAGRFLLASTGAVYGPQPPDLARMSEDYCGGLDPADVAMAGSEAKRAAEALCAVHADSDLRPVIARCFAFVGPYLPLEQKFAAGNFIGDGLRGGPIRVNGDGTPVRSYMYAADLAVWLWTILLRGQSMRPYNVGSEIEVSVGDLARAVARRFTPAPDIQIMRQAPQGAARQRYVPSTARARHELGLAMSIDFDEALDRTVTWQRARLVSTHGTN